MVLSRIALDWSNVVTSMKFQLSRSISLILAIIRLSSSYLLGSTFFVTLAQSTIGFQAALFPPFLALPPIQILNTKQSHFILKYVLAKYQIPNNRSIFQMKNRKQKPVQSKKQTHNLDETGNNHFSITNVKQSSGHTKVSTNCTIHSSVPAHLNIEKKMKGKKIVISAVKQNSGDNKKGQLSSKSNRKWKLLEIPLNSESPSRWVEEVSHREYCLVDQNFIPISPRNQQKLFEDFFSQTASTSYDFNYFNKISKNKVFQDENTVLRRKSVSSRKQRESNIKEAKTSIQKEDKAVSNLYQNKVYTSAEIEAVAEVNQIGMQYSERKQFIEQKIVQVQQKQEVKIQNEQNTTKQSLSDILFKLEFTHLMDDKSFNALTASEKEHFSQLLQSVMSKLSLKEKQPITKQKMKPILFDEIKQNQQDEEHILTQIYQKPTFQFPFQLSTPPNTVNFDKLEQLITRRQLLQKNIIQDTTRDINGIDTSLIAVLTFLGQLFCYIELQYTQEFIYMIRKMYGFNFKEKYKRITRNLPLTQDKKFRVVDQSLFLDFINQNVLITSNNNEIIHIKAIFDAFNEHLEDYRPYYTGNGQQFPWSFKLFTTMSEYSIDEDSLQIIFRQAKDKFVQWVQYLCGILVQYKEPLPEKNPLQQKRNQKEILLVNTWINEQNFQKDGIQLFCTQSLHNVSEDIYNQLIRQLLMDAAFLFI